MCGKLKRLNVVCALALSLVFMVNSHNAYAAGAADIFVKMQNGRTITLVLEPTDSIGVVKQKIEDNQGVAPNKQRLFYMGKELEDSKTLADYGIQKENMLILLLRLGGV